MLTKVLIQRIGRTFGQHHNLNAPVARALRIFGIQQHLVRHCAYLHHFIFRHSGLFQHPTSRKRAVTRKVPVVVDIVFVGHRIGMPGNNNFIIERVEHWRELHQQRFKERHNLRAAAFKHIAVLVIFNQHAQSLGNNLHLQIRFHMRITGNGVDTGCQLAKLGGGFLLQQRCFLVDVSRFFLRLFRHRHGGRFWRMRRADFI